jgi:protein KRI1
VNKDYAHRFEDRKRKQELDRLRQQYGDGALEDDSDDSEAGVEEDEDGEQLTRDVDVQIFRTIDAIRARDPAVRDPSKRFFEELPDPAERRVKPVAAAADAKKLTTRQYMLSGEHSDSDDDMPGAGKRKAKPKKIVRAASESSDGSSSSASSSSSSDEEDESAEEAEEEEEVVPYVEEQRRLKSAFLSAFDGIEGGDGQDDGTLLSTRAKSVDERKREEEDYAAWLREQLAKDKSHPVDERVSLRRYLDEPDSSLTKDERFLRDYVSKQLWRTPADNGVADSDDEDADPRLPRKSRADNAAEPADGAAADGAGTADDDGDFSDREAEFERKMNFRFEEPGAAKIAANPRRIADSVRRDPKKDARRAAETERDARKAEQLAAKKAELLRLKALKRDEILSRLDTIRKVSGGAKAEAFDADADFDPDNWDAQMSKVFGDDYYEQGEADPMFAQMVQRTEQEGLLGYDAAEDERDEDDEQGDAREARRAARRDAKAAKDAGKRKGKGGEFEAQVAQLADTIEAGGGARPNVRALLDEYYGLEYEDLIAGEIPTRFKYREVEPRAFGLNDEEILFSDDRELNRYTRTTTAALSQR